jgi:hypothetical protein
LEGILYYVVLEIRCDMPSALIVVAGKTNGEKERWYGKKGRREMGGGRERLGMMRWQEKAS